MEILFEDDLTMIENAIKNGDLQDALNLIQELKEESVKVLSPDVKQINMN